jgi:hybrid cluster-associated redox disulfide protein
MATKKKPSASSKETKERAVGAKITKDMTLGELVAGYPDAVPVLYKYGFHCIGCHMSAYETIEQGAAAHGMDAKAIAKMLEEMNAALKG